MSVAAGFNQSSRRSLELFIGAMSDPASCGGVTFLIVCREPGMTAFGRDFVYRFLLEHALTIATDKVALLADKNVGVARWTGNFSTAWCRQKNGDFRRVYTPSLAYLTRFLLNVDFRC